MQISVLRKRWGRSRLVEAKRTAVLPKKVHMGLRAHAHPTSLLGANTACHRKRL